VGFLVWYVINVAYNDYNKTVLKDLALPWIVSSLQLGLGLMLWVAPLWLLGLRKMPKISTENVRAAVAALGPPRAPCARMLPALPPAS
jgi:solute carrier family 35 protein E1